MTEWLVAPRDRPDRPVVRVSTRRPWYLLGLVGTVDLEPLDAAEGPGWCGVVRRTLEEPLLVGGRVVSPPHTRSAARVEAALGSLPAALVFYRSGAPAPAARPLPRPALPDWVGAAFLDRVGMALAAAEARGWGGPPLDEMEVLRGLDRAESEDALVAAAEALGAAARERPALAEALAEKVLPALAPVDEELSRRLQRALTGASP